MYSVILKGSLILTIYKIVIEKTAENDLNDILSYISNTLHEPVIAKKLYITIKENFSNLKSMPLRHKVVNEEPYRSIGMRMLLIENYIAFYVVDEDNKTVHIFRILYNRRDWQQIL